MLTLILVRHPLVLLHMGRTLLPLLLLSSLLISCCCREDRRQVVLRGFAHQQLILHLLVGVLRVRLVGHSPADLCLVLLQPLDFNSASLREGLVVGVSGFGKQYKKIL